MILTLIGARPQFVKAAVVSKAFQDAGIKELIIHSGQHYDERMSEVFWRELGIPKPAHNLQAGSGSHSIQTANIMSSLDQLLNLIVEPVKALLLYGDTNTTIAGALVASKRSIPVIHIEAGLRSFNREMPEEINRIVTDHLSSLLFCPSASSVEQLSREGITKNVYEVGDVMYDSFITFLDIAKRTVKLEPLLKPGESFILLTIHRPVNTDNVSNLQKILDQLGKLEDTIIWPMHPRNKTNLGIISVPPNLKVVDPLSYLEMLLMLDRCSKVITDSGGVQKEAYWAKKHCITLRDETEWIETLEGSWNILASVKENDLIRKVGLYPTTEWKPLYGDGSSASKITKIIKENFYQ